MNELWYYEHDGQARGPLPHDEIMQLVGSGAIGPTTLVWHEGLFEWTRLDAVAGRERGPPPLPPPVPPPPPNFPLRMAQTNYRPSRSVTSWPLVVTAAVGALLAAAAVCWIAGGMSGTAEPSTGVIAAAPTARASTPVRSWPIARPDIAEVAPAVAAEPAATRESSQPESAATTAPPAAPLPEASPAPGTISGKIENGQTLYQEIDVQRFPKFSVLGTVMAQDLAYKILSQLRVGAPNEHGVFQVEQVVQDTRLVKSDDLSRTMFEQSLRDLKGWQFTYKLSARREVIFWKAGPPDGKKAAAVEPKEAKGFLVTSVMDEDGWKELAQLSFFLPDPQTSRGTSSQKTWSRQMTHNFAPLGSWYGETKFVQKGMHEGLLRVEFTHHMTYQKPGGGIGADLPFKINDATFEADIAGGTIDFDAQARRVQRAQDNFRVTGQISAEVLGQSAAVEVEELQTIVVRLSEQNPWVGNSTSREARF